MIKSLVMGIKEILKSDRCIICDTKLEVLAWKKCEACSKYRRKTVKKEKASVTYFTIYNYSDVIKIYSVHPLLRKKNLSEKKCLVYDPEKMQIIGWK
jgi:hypothetical protein